VRQKYSVFEKRQVLERLCERLQAGLRREVRGRDQHGVRLHALLHPVPGTTPFPSLAVGGTAHRARGRAAEAEHLNELLDGYDERIANIRCQLAQCHIDLGLLLLEAEEESNMAKKINHFK